MMKTEARKAIARMDAAVEVYDPGQVTPKDRRAAMEQMDRAVEREAGSRQELWLAAAECQRTQAWKEDEGFLLTVANNPRHGGEKQTSHFEQWMNHRYDFQKSHANQLAQTGRMYELGAAPTTERQVRPLACLLKAETPDGDPGVVKRVWQAAVESAELEHEPANIAKHIKRLIDADPDLSRWRRTPEKIADSDEAIDKKIDGVRTTLKWLMDNMDSGDFDKRITQWLKAEVEYRI